VSGISAAWVQRSGLRRTVVVAEKATDPLAPSNPPSSDLASTIDQLVAEALMVAFAVVVDYELRERATEVALTQRYDPVQAFFLDRANKPLRVRIAVGASNGVWMRRTSEVSSQCRTAGLHFRSRSQIRKHGAHRLPSVPSVR
jgi:hypothetical protein